NTANIAEIDNLDGATIAASSSSTVTPLTGVNFGANAIVDFSGKLVKIENSGQIVASTSTPADGQQAGVAINVSQNTTGVTIDDGIAAGTGTGTINGSVIFGTGADTLNVGTGLSTGNLTGA